MDTSAGVTSIPAPVEPNANEVDIALMWRAVRKQRHGVSNPSYLIIGILMTALNSIGISVHPDYHWLSIACGLTFIVLGLSKSGTSVATLRPFEVTFSSEGIIAELPGTILVKALKSYPWKSIRRVDDIGDSFVVVPWFRLRIVLPKRSFPDRGREVWAFFVAHGVAGRVVATAQSVHA